MFIREAMASDLDAIANCGERFFNYAGFDKKGLSMDRDSFKDMVLEYIEDENGIVLLLMNGLNVAGGICGSVQPWGFNKAIRMGSELFYWIDDQHRGSIKSIQLLSAYDKRVAELGADVNVMVSVDTHLQPKVNHLYERKGYLPLEQFFIKAI